LRCLLRLRLTYPHINRGVCVLDSYCCHTSAPAFPKPSASSLAVAAVGHLFPEGSVEYHQYQRLRQQERRMRRRRASYAEAAGYRGVMEQLYRMAAQQGHPHPESHAGNGEGADAGEFGGPHGSSASPAGEGYARSPAGGAGSVHTGSHPQPRAVAIPDPSIFAPITVELDANTVASVRRCRNGYTLDVTFTATPVGVALTHNVVSGTEPGSYGEGIVGPGDELLRIGIHNVPRGPPPKKPRRAIPGQRRRWRAPTASEVSCVDALCWCRELDFCARSRSCCAVAQNSSCPKAGWFVEIRLCMAASSVRLRFFVWPCLSTAAPARGHEGRGRSHAAAPALLSSRRSRSLSGVGR